MRNIAINPSEMAEAGDIAGISIPFTAGVAAASLVPAGPVRQQVCAAAVILAVATMALFCRQGNQKAVSTLMFFCLGAAGLLSYEGADRVPGSPLKASGAMKSLCGIIDSIQFADTRTGALAKALLTGSKEGLDEETVRIFRSSGAAHILALSGLHLGIIYAILGRVLSIFGNSRTASAARSLVTVTASFFYMVMTGASPSIVRAFLFITVNETLKHSPGRRREALRVLFCALLIQLAAMPSSIRSLGFQLSYLAMLGIFTIYPHLEKWYPGSLRFDIPGMIWKSLAMSLSCQAFTAPLVWKRFHTFPKYFLLTNLIALPLSELFMLSAIVCIAGAAAGWCPDIMKSPVDALARTLLFCLETISSI